MKIVCLCSLLITAACSLLLGLALFDLVDLPASAHGLTGVAAVVALAIFIKSYIRLTRSTRRH